MAELDAMIARLKALGGPNVAVEVAREAAPLVDEAIKKTAGAGTDPDGKAWAPKKNGGRALEHAADHIKTSAVGVFVSVILSGVDVFHHKGQGHSPRRQVLPEAGSVPAGVTKALQEGARRVFERLAGGTR